MIIFKILVIEDDESSHIVYHSYFKKIIIPNVKIEYNVASNLIDAELICNIFKPDCILLDLNLNGIPLDGLNISKFYSVDKCVIISGFLDFETIKLCNNFGFFKFICKPFNYNSLFAIISQFYNIYKDNLDLIAKDESIRRKFQENMILVDDLQDQYYLQDTILSIIPAIIYIKDLDLKYITVNNKFLEINNMYNINNIIGKTDYDIFDIDHAEKYSNEDKNIINDNIELINVLNFSNSRSKFEWTLTSKYPLYHDNKISGIIGIIIDITASIKLEKIIENTFNAIKDGICIIDSNKKIIKTNKILDFWYSDQIPLVGKYCNEVFINDCEICEICPNKIESEKCVVTYNKHWFEIEYYPIEETSNIICYRRDITKTYLLEEEIKKSKLIYEDNLKLELNKFKQQWLENSNEFDTNINNSINLLSSISI